jgi:hypothetical protein
MENKKLCARIGVSIITLCLIIGLFYIPYSFANQPCFKCCGSGIWHVDNKMPCSGKSSDSSKRCESCKGLGQVHKSSKKVCIGAGCNYCSSCKSCKTKGWVRG